MKGTHSLTRNHACSNIKQKIRSDNHGCGKDFLKGTSLYCRENLVRKAQKAEKPERTKVYEDFGHFPAQQLGDARITGKAEEGTSR
jgi:hypothetical protein